MVPKLDANRMLKRFKDKVIKVDLEHKPIEHDLIIDLQSVNEGRFRIQIVEPVDIGEETATTCIVNL